MDVVELAIRWILPYDHARPNMRLGGLTPKAENGFRRLTSNYGAIRMKIIFCTKRVFGNERQVH